jgi:hypothetical protein
MLEAIVGLVAGLLIVAGVVVIVGPRTMASWIAALRRSAGSPSTFEPPRTHDAGPAVNPQTQRVVAAASRLASWLLTHGNEEASRDIRGAAARLAGNEPAGLYALQTAMRRMRVAGITDAQAQRRLKALVAELRAAVQDRFEQLELLPFRRG